MKKFQEYLKKDEDVKDELGNKIIGALGEADDTKVFLASLLVSLLRSQQIAARKLAESRMKQS